MNNVLKLVDGNTRVLELSEDLISHFENNGNNHAQTIMNQINEQGFYESFFENKSDLTVLDIGANIGLFSLHVMPACKKLVALEPTPSHFEKFSYLCNGTIIEGRNVALSNVDGTAQFNLDAANTTMNGLVKHWGTVDTIEVPCVKLLTLLETEGLEKVDFCKIDIEGSEVIALTQETISEVANKIDNWFVEVHPTTSLDGMSQQQNKEKIWAIFEACGYIVRDINFETFYVSRA